MVGGSRVWDWMRMMLNFVDFHSVNWWGYFWNKFIYKGIDELCYWFESLLSNHVTCTCGIFCLDMILIEIIQMENPRHVIDAMSSMKLVLNLWRVGGGFLWIGLFLVCRKFLQRMELVYISIQMDSLLLKAMRKLFLFEEDKRSKRKRRIDGRRSGRRLWIESLIGFLYSRDNNDRIKWWPIYYEENEWIGKVQLSISSTIASDETTHLKLSSVGSSNPWELNIASPSDGRLYCIREGHSGTTQIPHFDWTGPLRPYPISKKHVIPAGIELPDWAVDVSH
ncbi:unnamed protein product [Lactuca virosa]|uniref:Uncharacterized protein n=1 Tax=Lactuca virosa TaxID=75947 RepID=A0AAU9M5H2_9ASTR|nr:unnamed protein product [Lactuca virosa]